LILQQRIKHRIEQAKKQIHPTHNRAFIDSVLIEIDTLDHDLAQHSKRNC
jgi:hypothetical protein